MCAITVWIVHRRTYLHTQESQMRLIWALASRHKEDRVNSIALTRRRTAETVNAVWLVILSVAFIIAQVSWRWSR